MVLPTTLDEVLLRGAVVLTPNQRAARSLSEAFDQNRRAQGLQSWTPASVLPFGAWTNSIWTECLISGLDARVLLNDLQELSLWEEVLRDEGADTPGTPRTVAKLCAGAHRLLHDFGAAGPLSTFTDGASSDAQIYARWLDRFEARCRREQLLPSAELNRSLAEILRSKAGDGLLAREFFLYGFDRLLQSQENLVRVMKEAGASVTVVDAYAGAQTAAPTLMAAESEPAELQACVAWVRRRLESSPQASIAIIVPDLKECASEIERALRNAVAPETMDITTGSAAVPWHVSEGKPLSAVPLAADALRLLRWCAAPVPLNDITALLLSPYLRLADSEEHGAEVDAFVLRQGKSSLPEMSIEAVAAQCSGRHRDLVNRLHALAETARTMRGSRSFAAWGDAVRSLLQSAGWPGTRERNSEEFQVVKRWEEMLDRLATLDLLYAGTAYADFLTALLDCAADTLFAPENTGAPIQVMSVPEAAGSAADALWFLHGDEQAWSSRRGLHPLLPGRLQREFAMPGANAGLDADHAAAVTSRIARSATEVSFSFAETTTAGSQRASTLIRQLPGLVYAHATPENVPERESAVEEIEDTSTIPALPDAVVRGGVGVLQMQAACGFRAFAEKRLFSTDVRERKLGLEPRDRGDLVHKALESFWRRTSSQAKLRESMRTFVDGESERDHTLRISVDEAFGTLPMQRWESAYIDVQKQRLFQLLQRWLDYERTRPPFEVIHLEHTIRGAQVGPLRLDLRVDRIDHVLTDEGRAAVLIDYKTGAVHPNTWSGGRPEEPQLPVYAIAAGIDDVQAVAFASVRAGEDNRWLRGWPGKSALLPENRLRSPEDFDGQVTEWRTVVERLARQFAEGDAFVDPKQYPKTCTHCGQRFLCRLDPATLLEVADEDADGVADEGETA